MFAEDARSSYLQLQAKIEWNDLQRDAVEELKQV